MCLVRSYVSGLECGLFGASAATSSPTSTGYTLRFDINHLRIASAFDRLAEARLQASMVPEDAEEVWCYGVGLWDLPLVLLERPELKKLHIVPMRGPWIAPDEIRREDRVVFHRAEEIGNLYGPLCLSPVDVRLADPSAHHLRDRLIQVLNDPVNKKFREARKKIEDANAAENVKMLDPRISRYFGTAKGMAIVIAAGPSLSRFYGWIAQHPEATVICASTALRPVYEHGITPDYAVVLDPAQKMIRHFQGVDRARVEYTTLVYTPSVHPAIPRMWCGPRAVASCDDSDGSELFSGGSVLHAAVDLAVKIGCKTVCLVGVDLCHANEQSHVAGAANAYDLVDPCRPTVINGLGQTVRTEDSLCQYRRTLEDYIGAHPGVRWEKLGREGVPLKGAEWVL